MILWPGYNNPTDFHNWRGDFTKSCTGKIRRIESNNQAGGYEA
jgi:hypothetical protein